MPFSKPDWPPVGESIRGWKVLSEVTMRTHRWWGVELQCESCGRIKPDHWAREVPAVCWCHDPYPVGSVAGFCLVTARRTHEHSFECSRCGQKFSRSTNVSYEYPNIICPHCSARPNPFEGIYA